MIKKYRAQHIKIFAVYKKYFFMGAPARSFRMAFPNYTDAQKWIDQSDCGEKDNYMIEEMAATMKAWQP